jgi:Uma2 family endonuclease
MTLEAFLAWEDKQPDRWEFDGFEPVAMVGGTAAHSLIVLNVAACLRDRLRGGPCRAYIEGLKIRTAGSIRYPDVFVACGPIMNTATVAEDPVVVVEVLSPGTMATDIVVKNREYRATPSILRYVMLTQDAIGATVYERRGTDWLATSITDPAASLDMPEIATSLPLAACYEGVIEP